MISSEYASTNEFSNKSVFKEFIKDFQQKPESNFASRCSSIFKPKPLNRLIFNSSISKDDFSNLELVNSYCSIKSGKDGEIYGNPFNKLHLKNGLPFFYDFPKEYLTKDHQRYKANGANFGKPKLGRTFKLDPTNILFNNDEHEIEGENEESESITFFGQKKDEKKVNFDNYKFNEDFKMEKNRNSNKNIAPPNNNNLGTKFFTNHNYGYKCSCTKTNCNRKYCECFNAGNYCIDCNCKNCQNKPPINVYTNKRPDDLDSKSKKNKEICTCTKSGCNKNYCECFKSGNKCSSLCRCIGCENTEDNEKLKNKIYNHYKCCPANSICIMKNKIFVEKSDIKVALKEGINNRNNDNEGKKCKVINKKRRREENKIDEEVNISQSQRKKNNEEEEDLFNDSLFDKNGKVILRYINLIHYD
mgnify:CR=1 FL=1